MSLTIGINSFSYKNGIPADINGNGGGFVFDCRGIQNPGRIDQYKKLSGLDQKVQEFLEKQSDISNFLESIYQIIKLTIDSYLEIGFNHLQVNFGCTGGQHRSVYSAEYLAKYIKTTYNSDNVNIILTHTNKHNWKK